MRLFKQLLRDYLVNHADAASLRAVVGERLYPAELANVQAPTFPLICFKASGENQNQTVTAMTGGTLQTWAWSTESQDHADMLHDLLRVAVHNVALVDTTVGRSAVVTLVSGPENVTDDASSPVVYGAVGTWRLFVKRL